MIYESIHFAASFNSMHSFSSFVWEAFCLSPQSCQVHVVDWYNLMARSAALNTQTKYLVLLYHFWKDWILIMGVFYWLMLLYYTVIHSTLAAIATILGWMYVLYSSTHIISRVLYSSVGTFDVRTSNGLSPHNCQSRTKRRFEYNTIWIEWIESVDGYTISVWLSHRRTHLFFESHHHHKLNT